MNKVTRIAIIATGVVALGTAIVLCSRSQWQPSGTAASSPSPENQTRLTAGARESAAPQLANAPSSKGKRGLSERRKQTASVAVQPAASRRDARPSQAAGGRAREIVQRLSQIEPGPHGFTSEQISEVNRLWQELAEQHASAIPAIREFLDEGVDLIFETMPESETARYVSLRLGLLTTMIQSGGEEGLSVAAETLQTTADPLEIALLSRVLEEQAPGQYRELSLEAARVALAQASRGDWDGQDVSPLFEVIERFGDTKIISDLEKAVKQWNYYATLSLAGLPEGAGIPSLIKLARDPEIRALGQGAYALRPLAQVALQYPDARAALIEQGRANQVPDDAWPAVASALAGASIRFGNELLPHTAAGTGGKETTDQRIALIDQLLAVTSNPAGVQALRDARLSLTIQRSKS